MDSSVDGNNVKDESLALLKKSLVNSSMPSVGDMTNSSTTTPSKVEGITFAHAGKALFESSFTFPDSTVQTPSPSA